MIKVSNIKLPVGHDNHALLLAIGKKLRIPKEQIGNIQILKRSIDARKKPQLYFVYQVLVETDQEHKILQFLQKKHKRPSQDIEHYNNQAHNPLRTGEELLENRPVVIGTGPAGLMAALLLAENGYKPLVFERGKNVHKRADDIQLFWQTGELHPESNVQFGEGGAGTFSDGKLTTRIRDTRIDKVYQYLVEAGAPEEILYINKPHIGTDKLRLVVERLRNRLEHLGGEVFFNHKLIDMEIKNNELQGVLIKNLETEQYIFYPTQQVVLAIGHSARDTYEMLHRRNVSMDAKALAIGVRIEHPQTMINYSQYGAYDIHSSLGAAEYQLVKKKDLNCNRTVYSFCMCPGGVVVAAASEPGGVVTNGMSYHARDLKNANAALVVNIDPEDFGYSQGKSPLLGIDYLRKWERQAFNLGGGNYHAPAQLVKDFLQGVPTEDFTNTIVTPSYSPGVKGANLHECLPDFVAEALMVAIREFGKRIAGFDMGDAVLTGVETRTSSPIRIHRLDNGESVSLKGLYPTGEGAGYAGGIISAAVDGLKAAEQIISKYAPIKLK
ncbi:NAD(P)/FAD-dependent oxidoreductase [Desulfuribacillus alkaliarsenatis]|uniref:FAD-dependent protein C-terminal domain-containing protein n=1 Tax=Desulfuribacillus alkaliarsenatis TaxID=766136 RepID=A0A1E5G3K3_9FIRM|nr:NAD(P)/FAD-dependent oxidoreductase [Desulfuribacillus alkaliarsenatis]OEF97667.1 hypothetical protein BHF68_14285 [Desulfuribacillus alkaliarsenatis]